MCGSIFHLPSTTIPASNGTLGTVVGGPVKIDLVLGIVTASGTASVTMNSNNGATLVGGAGISSEPAGYIFGGPGGAQAGYVFVTESVVLGDGDVILWGGGGGATASAEVYVYYTPLVPGATIS